jgi:hypothetical protein
MINHKILLNFTLSNDERLEHASSDNYKKVEVPAGTLKPVNVA